jgi:hypothetical protein
VTVEYTVCVTVGVGASVDLGVTPQQRQAEEYAAAFGHAVAYEGTAVGVTVTARTASRPPTSGSGARSKTRPRFRVVVSAVTVTVLVVVVVLLHNRISIRY